MNRESPIFALVGKNIKGRLLRVSSYAIASGVLLVASEKVAPDNSTVYSAANYSQEPVSRELNLENDKVTICHRTNSITNPYVEETVDRHAVDGIAGNSLGNQPDHFGEHKGSLFDPNNPPQPPHNGDQWGDIIPPVEPYHDGLNWVAGRAVLENDCEFPTPTNTPTLTPTERATINTSTPTNTPGEKATNTPTVTNTPGEQVEPSPTPTRTATPTSTPTPGEVSIARATSTPGPGTQVVSTVIPIRQEASVIPVPTQKPAVQPTPRFLPLTGHGPSRTEDPFTRGIAGVILIAGGIVAAASSRFVRDGKTSK